MKVSLAFDSEFEYPFPEQFVKLEDERNGEYILHLIEVAFAEEMEDNGIVEVRIHQGGEYVVDNARIKATYDI